MTGSAPCHPIAKGVQQSKSELENVIRTMIILWVEWRCHRSTIQRCEASDTVVENYQLMMRLGTSPRHSYSVNKVVITRAANCIACAGLLAFVKRGRLTSDKGARLTSIEEGGSGSREKKRKRVDDVNT